MRNIVALALFAALLGVCGSASALPQGNHGDHHDNGKHKGWDKHEDRGEGHHDNGNHYGQYKHSEHDYDEHLVRVERPYAHGRYEHVKHIYVSRTYDVRSRRVILGDRSNWVVASYDAPECRDWNWGRDSVYVYDDDRHPGWYLLFNARLGRSVHVQFFGVN